ncbi:NirD/YgiW/YdeI family stress tolerance protein [Rhodobacteraceae bacterium RKSG542]|uniref:NirD/YgiW/YdeI family stress tolerance protein n=1 Tax=Pseudovibrio flavus TaxID=2529854 RepID=UPI0012BBB00B|nr:NirD/YgiW/YdeI family stress tolerance protein [Pseudovibrio flavus]MTI17515.1 NirD/YgiW/YdeI family stress tolerance protein [Pseudovibrio flavus]
MKKLLSAALALSLVCSSGLAYAASPAQTGTHAEATAKAATAEKDGAKVKLKGNIDKKLGDDKYQFSDDSGIIIVEIDEELAVPDKLAADTPVLIFGEIDQDAQGNIIEVEAIEFLN